LFLFILLIPGFAPFLQPPGYDAEVHPAVISACADELQKIALKGSTLVSYLKARSAQGVGGAGALSKGVSSTGTSREAVKKMTGMQKHQLKQTAVGGQGVRKAQALSARSGVAPERARLQGAAATPVKELRAGGVEMGGGAGSIMKGKTYGPAGVSKMTGVSPEEGRRSVAAFRRHHASRAPVADTGSGMRVRGRVDPHGATQLSAANTSTAGTSISRPKKLQAKRQAMTA
jgi:hypothetical protein